MALLPHSVIENYEISPFFNERSIDILCTFAIFSLLWSVAYCRINV